MEHLKEINHRLAPRALAWEGIRGDWSTLGPLYELAGNLWWSWNADAKDVFARTNPVFWEREKNPLKMLNKLSEKRRQELTRDRGFQEEVDQVYRRFLRYMHTPPVSSSRWFREHPGQIGPDIGQQNPGIAYFCSEYGIHESFPNYSGGLGILAGDHVKTASDLNLPFVAIGLLYRRGFFEQKVDPKLGQVEEFPELDFDQLPVLPVMKKHSREHLLVEIPMTSTRMVRARVWRLPVGRVNLFLLDTNIEENSEKDRDITDSLYSGDHEHRLQQEMVLGVGGSRLLRELNFEAGCYHLNEGHAAFCALDRLHHFMNQEGLGFEQALEMIRATTVFTTHTPVPAGNQVYSAEMVLEYARPYLDSAGTGISDNSFLALGREKIENEKDRGFAMTVYCLRMAGMCNGVSQLHGHVSRQMWQPVWPELAVEQVPIDSVTNAIHLPSWIAPEFQALFEKYMAGDQPDWLMRATETAAWRNFDAIPDQDIRDVKRALKVKLIDYIRNEERRKLKEGRSLYVNNTEIDELLDPDALTIGFARRFATYKRATLLFHDLERLKKILKSADRPVQFVFSGKAHFRDEPGKKFLKKVVDYVHKEGLTGKVVFVENYNIKIGRLMVQGVDLWLNNPRRPHEASGTSGMKVPVNGGLNFSILDGWWPEAFAETLGWSIGGTEEFETEKEQDEFDSNQLYATLEEKILPAYYGAGGERPTAAWMRLSRNSIRTCVPMFHFNRMLTEYVDKFYRSGIRNYLALSGKGLLQEIVKRKINWRRRIGRANLNSLQCEPVAPAGMWKIRGEIALSGLKHRDGEVWLEIFPEGSKEAFTHRMHIRPDSPFDLWVVEALLPAGEHLARRINSRQPGGAIRLRLTPGNWVSRHREPGLIKILDWC